MDTLAEIEEMVSSRLTQFKSDLSIEAQNTLYHFKEQLTQLHAKEDPEFLPGLSENTLSYGKLLLSHKKYQFYLGYLGFVLLNLFIFGLLF
ncbi:MAG: hypothetical protein H6765_09340 [Candidatus Peribacteria bacterium]|nr:MAG: hypothetical protein H6765_09340 [Candidatus Peribacteria bacterium]